MASYGERSTPVRQALTGSQTTPQYKAGVTSAFARQAAVKSAFQKLLQNNPQLQAGIAAKNAGTAAPAAPARPQFDPNNLPLDPSYDAQVLGLQQNRDTGLASLAQQRTYQLGTAGYNATYDDKGNAAGLSFDPNNPYSRAALAKQTYDNTKRGTTNSMAARGQLYSGALINAQNANDTNYSVGEDSRQKALLNFLAQNLISQTGTKNAYETGVATASGDRLSRALQNFLAQNGG